MVMKRLATSVVLAARQQELGAHRCEKDARLAVASYRLHMQGYARMRALEVWYSQLDA
jgi:hypothetical protein